MDEASVSEVIPSAEEIERRIDQAATSKHRRPVLAVATDGAHTKIRPLTENKQEITDALKLAAQRIPQHKVRIGLIGDGTHWLWTCMREAFPQGRQILNYYHCSEYIHKVAELQFADDPDKALHWVESTRLLSVKWTVSATPSISPPTT
jgi:tRNA A37 threonylcarbamoyladenosine synthetase subunit TsaC/SUA5/YrdC